MKLRCLLFIAFSILPQSVFAQGSGHTGGGDGWCENQINKVRTEFVDWIKQNGHKQFSFADALVTEKNYRALMLNALTSKSVTISCVSPTQWNPEPIQVMGEPKTCAWSRGKDAESSIQCNSERLEKTPIEYQYLLIHHEFAGIAGIELPQGKDSTYPLSRQIPELVRIDSNGRAHLNNLTPLSQIRIYKSDVESMNLLPIANKTMEMLGSRKSYLDLRFNDRPFGAAETGTLVWTDSLYNVLDARGGFDRIQSHFARQRCRAVSIRYFTMARDGSFSLYWFDLVTGNLLMKTVYSYDSIGVGEYRLNVESIELIRNGVTVEYLF